MRLLFSFIILVSMGQPIAAFSAALPASRIDSDGAWSELGSPRGVSASIYDPLRNRLVVLVGTDVWAVPLDGPPVWEKLQAAGTPASRFAFGAAYDPVRDRVLIFGGHGLNFDFLNEVWALSLSALLWEQLTPAEPFPTRRFAAGWIYDPVRDRMIAFGGLGYDTPYLNDVWALSLQGEVAWTELLPAGAPPSPRRGHGSVYDPVRDRLVVAGGLEASYLDTWALTLAGTPTWTQLNPPGTLPSWRSNHAALYDPNGDRLIIDGGYTFVLEPLAETWALPLSGTESWTRIADQVPMPNPRSGHGAVYDPARARMLIHGTSGPTKSETWALSLTGIAAWSFLFDNDRPPERSAYAGVFDSGTDGFLVFGGGYDTFGASDTWTFSLRSEVGWSQLPIEGVFSSPRTGAAAIYDPVRHRVIIFGGKGGFTHLNDVWALSLDSPPRWVRLEPLGDLPGPRSGHVAVYDPVRDRMVIHGGVQDDMLYVSYGDMWALSLTDPPTWTRLAAFGPEGQGRSAIYDPGADRLLVFGGAGNPRFREPPTNGTWASPLGGAAEWTMLTPLGTLPPPRGDHTSVYDAARRRMVVFGGGDGSRTFDDTWELLLEPNLTWRQLSPLGVPPPARAKHAAIYDPIGHRMIVFSGTGGTFGRSDTWSLTFGALTVEVLIDVRPGDPHNTISLRSRGLVPLAVMGSVEVDVVTIDLSSIRLAGAPVAEAHGRPRSSIEDVNGDGRMDLLVRFQAEALVLGPGDTSIELEGRTHDGTLLHGSDAVHIVPPNHDSIQATELDMSRPVGHRGAEPQLELRYLASGRPVVRLTLGTLDGPFQVEVLAVDGRRVWTSEIPAGAAREWTYDLGEIGGLRAGVYWLRLRQGRADVAAKKFVRLE